MCGLLSDIDDCISVTCNNGGTCEDGINSFTCVCSYGYTGKFCDTGKQIKSLFLEIMEGERYHLFLLFHGHKACTINIREQQQRTTDQRRRWIPKILIDVAMRFRACELNLIFPYVPQFSLQLSW